MKRLFLLMVFLAASIQVEAAKMSSYTNNTTPNEDVYFIGVDPNDTTQTANGSNYRYSLSSILGSGLLNFNVNSLTVSGTGDSWLELENNTSFTDSLTGKYGIRFYNGALQQILNGTATNIGSASIQELASDPTYTDLDTGEMAVSTASGDLFIKTATGLYTIAGTYTADPTTPTLTSMTIPEAGTTAEGIFSEAMAIGAGGAGGWTLINPEVAMTYTSGTGVVGDPAIFNLASTILSTDTPTVSYTQPTNGFESSDDGVDLASIPGAAVANTSEQPGGADYSDILLYWGAENSSTADKPSGLTAASSLTYQTSPKLAGSYSAKYTSGTWDSVQWANTADAILNRSEGRAGLWYFTGSTITEDNVLFEATYDASNYFRLRHSGSTGFGITWVGNGVTYKGYKQSIITTSTAYYVEISWDATGVKLFVDGVEHALTKTGTYTSLLASPANGSVSIGASPQVGGSPVGASYDQLFISNDSARDLYVIREVTNVD